MMVGPNPGHGFNMATIPTFEETIANLPYDAMQATRQLSHPSGTVLHCEINCVNCICMLY